MGSRDKTQAFGFVRPEFYQLSYLSRLDDSFLDFYPKETVILVALEARAWAETVAQRERTQVQSTAPETKSNQEGENGWTKKRAFQ